MAIRDELIKAVKDGDGRADRITTIADGIRELAALNGASSTKISASVNIENATNALFSAEAN